MRDKIMGNMNQDKTQYPTETPLARATPLDKVDTALSEVFGTAPIVKVDPSEVVIVQDPAEEKPDKQIEVDAAHARSNLYDLIQKGQDALGYAIDIAKQTDKPQAFEAVTNMIKTLTETNLQLLDILEKKQKLSRPGTNGRMTKEEANGNVPQQVTNQSIFVGSTSELAKMLSNLKGEEK